jgi:hypothetical protein
MIPISKLVTIGVGHAVRACPGQALQAMRRISLRIGPIDIRASRCEARTACPTVLICLLVGTLQAQDRVTFVDRSSKTGATLLRSGSITVEDPGKVTITSSDGRRSDIPVSDIIDVLYEGEPQSEMNAARTAERERRYDAALAAYADASKKVTADKKLLRRHLEYKEAEMRTAQAEAGTNPGAALDALRAFAKNHSECRQVLSCYDALGRLLIIGRQPIAEVVEALAQLRSKFGTDNKDVASRCDLLRSDLIVQELEQVFLKEGLPVAKSKSTAAAKSLAELVTIADRTIEPELTAKVNYCKAYGDPNVSFAAWDGQLKATEDPHSRAAIHLIRGDYYRLSNNMKEAMWDYLWVDTVYFADRNQQAKALFQLIEVFDKLGDTAKSRDCKERLQSDGRLRDTRYSKAIK